MQRPGRLALISGAAALTLLAAACSQPSAARLNQDGNQAYNRADYAAALDDYLKAEIDRPDLPGLNYNAGNVYFQQGQYDRGISESLRSTESGPDDVRERSYYTIGADYYREGKLQDALEAFKSALRIDPNDVDAKYNVEVIQRQLAQQNADQQQSGNNQQQGQQSQQNQQGQQSDQQNQQGQQGQQAQQQGQQGQQSQQGQQQGQQGQQSSQSGNAGQQQAGGQAAGQPDQNAQQPGSGAQNQSGGQPGSASGGQSGAANPGAQQQDARAQQAQLGQELQQAEQDYQQAPSIEGALRILDLQAQLEQIAQADRTNRTNPNTPDK